MLISRRGTALTQTLVLSLVIVAIAVAVIKWQAQRHQASAKSYSQSELAIDTTGTRNSINACLGGAGYPSGSCQPNAAQSACIPSGLSVSFSGTPPNCEMQITATR